MVTLGSARAATPRDRRRASARDDGARPMKGPGQATASGPELRASVQRLMEQHVLDTAVDRTRMAMTLADPNLPDCPLVYVNPAFERLTGYSSAEVVGRNCRFLQGPRTDAESVKRIASALRERRDLDEELYNYRRDGSGFWNALYMSPVFDDGGHLAYFFSSQFDVSARRESQARQAVLLAELHHRTRNLIGVVEALSSQTLRGSTSLDDFATRYAGRLGALARSQKLLAEGAVDTIDLRELVETELRALGGAPEGRISLDGPPVALPAHALQITALALHELATNAVKYGALSQPEGRLGIVWRLGDGGRRVDIEWRESGVAMPAPGPDVRRGYGTELIERALPFQLGAETSLRRLSDGVRCAIALPIVTTVLGELHG